MIAGDYFDYDKKSSRKDKMIILSVIFAAGIVTCLLQFFKIQILEGHDYLDKSIQLSQRSKVIAPQRGEIYDRYNDTPLAINIDSFAIDMIPGEIPVGQYDTVAVKLANFLGIPKSEIDKKVPNVLRRSFNTIEIKANLDFETIIKVAESSTDLPGVIWRSKPIRNYTETNSFSHILGYVGNINNDELKILYNKGYRHTSVVGKSGVEKQYDSVLQGTPGAETRSIDVRGRLLPAPPTVRPPIMGNSLVLTIDRRIQKLAEDTLGERIGAAVVLKPSTGEILALASYPYYDSNAFISDESGSAYRRVENMPNSPLVNRAINSTYPPASTFKVVMTMALLAENLIPKEKYIECKGVLSYGDRKFRCHVGVPGHGNMNMINALAQSCNVYYWTTGRDYLGVEKIAKYAGEIGFGHSTEIDLPLLNSSTGIVPTPIFKERRFHEKWLGGDTLNMSIGQGYTTVTPLHVANMMAMIVNEGVIYKPRVLKEIRNSVNSELIETKNKEILIESDIPNSVWKDMKEFLRYMVTNGSAQFPLRNKKVQIAGKTGTGEDARYKKQWHSWFVGFAPFDAPKEEQLIVAVLVEAINVWEWWAPYASNIIFQGIFEDQTYDEAINELGYRYLEKPVGRRE